jgi:hypothetical protein
MSVFGGGAGTDNKALNEMKEYTKTLNESSLRIERSIEELNKSSETLEHLTFGLIVLTLLLVFSNIPIMVNAIKDAQTFGYIEAAILIVAALVVGIIYGKNRWKK